MSSFLWSERQDSNLRPHAPKACALPTAPLSDGRRSRIRTHTNWFGISGATVNTIRLYVRFSVTMKIFNFHIVSMTFIMLNFLLWPDQSICHCGQRYNCHNDHSDKHHHEYHFFGPYKDLDTPIKNTTLTPIPQPKMTAEFGSLKKSISPIFFTSCFNYSECTQD